MMWRICFTLCGDNDEESIDGKFQDGIVSSDRDLIDVGNTKTFSYPTDKKDEQEYILIPQDIDAHTDPIKIEDESEDIPTSVSPEILDDPRSTGEVFSKEEEKEETIEDQTVSASTEKVSELEVNPETSRVDAVVSDKESSESEVEDFSRNDESDSIGSTPEKLTNEPESSNLVQSITVAEESKPVIEMDLPSKDEAPTTDNSLAINHEVDSATSDFKIDEVKEVPVEVTEEMEKITPAIVEEKIAQEVAPEEVTVEPQSSIIVEVSAKEEKPVVIEQQERAESAVKEEKTSITEPNKVEEPVVKDTKDLSTEKVEPIESETANSVLQVEEKTIDDITENVAPPTIDPSTNVGLHTVPEHEDSEEDGKSTRDESLQDSKMIPERIAVEGSAVTSVTTFAGPVTPNVGNVEPPTPSNNGSSGPITPIETPSKFRGRKYSSSKLSFRKKSSGSIHNIGSLLNNSSHSINGSPEEVLPFEEALKKGIPMVKKSRMGMPATRIFTATPGLETIGWGNKRFSMKDCREVIRDKSLGARTVSFRFDSRTLDVTAQSEKQADDMAAGFTDALHRLKKAKSESRL